DRCSSHVGPPRIGPFSSGDTSTASDELRETETIRQPYFLRVRRRACAAPISPVAARISVVGSGVSPAFAVRAPGMLNGNGARVKTIALYPKGGGLGPVGVCV